ncbi:mannose-1-phosphate guanylyltransferase [Pseudomonas synxantha]|jgi:phosphomannomutase|uniref:Phosphomannomutase n=1 Tax=Pseudomonas synxantha TaxID=47883 RepID=A0ACC6JQF5_9PSED|nr:mannose-1-phosphate guanylyltransferase [Pseudomonas synxantha]MDR6608782.1 phosphomannomutase [Pseudomonas synxantha]
MNASRSPIDSVYTSLDPFAPGNMVFGQKFTEGNSGLMAWLRTYERAPSANSTQPRLLVERIGLFPSSGEIRCAVRNPTDVLEHLCSLYAGKALDMDESNGLSLTFTEWRFKVHLSETESEILLTVESRGDVALMQLKTAELLARIDEKSSSES